MHAKRVLHYLLTDVCHGMHAARRQAIAVGVVTALRGTCLTVTALGRSIESTAKEKHCIKRADRLLANHDVPTESFGAYVALGHRLIGGTTRALIVVDWSDLDATKTHVLLRAAVPVGGRVLTVYEEGHTGATKAKPTTYRMFVERWRRV